MRVRVRRAGHAGRTVGVRRNALLRERVVGSSLGFGTSENPVGVNKARGNAGFFTSVLCVWCQRFP